MKRVGRRHGGGVDAAEQILAGEHVREGEIGVDELRAVEGGKDKDLAERLVRGRQVRHQVLDAFFCGERGVQGCGVEGQEARGYGGVAEVEDVVADAGEVGEVGEDVDEGGGGEDGGGEVDDLGGAGGFADPSLEFGVLGDLRVGGVVGCDEGGHEGLDVGADEVGVFEKGEALEGGAVGAVQQSSGDEIFLEIVGLEGAGGLVVGGGAELGKGLAAVAEEFIKNASYVRQGYGPGRSHGVSLVHDCRRISTRVC